MSERLFSWRDSQPGRVLGKAVHPLAIRRLLELWPDASVTVRHLNSRYDGVDLKVTWVNIVKHPDPVPTASTPMALGDARCRLDCDQWDRHYGIDLAFRRALEHVKALSSPRQEGKP